MFKISCKKCNKDFVVEFPSEEKRRKFCSLSCYAKYVNTHRLILEETKRKMSEARKLYYENGGEKPKYWLGKKRSAETIEKFRQSMKGKLIGEKNPNWKGGITNPRHKIMMSEEYKDWRIAVFQKDDFTCQRCGARSGNGKTVILNADHIKPFSLYPELRFDIDNGRTLCVNCHIQTESFGGRAVALKYN